ncbi:MAG: nucleotidyltransferase domain-containing protein [Candidatus Methanoperedens sp.]|nr:nucleotidyltransferase domain-containing protein [Candidatus Methanoperedens sp.]
MSKIINVIEKLLMDKSKMKTKSEKIEPKTDEILEALKSFDIIHSVLIFGSRARGKTGRYLDLCIIPSREPSLRERLSIDSAMPSGVDISMYHELPVHIRKRIAEEGKVLYTKDMYHLLTLLKENDLEYVGYRKYREYYNNAMRERMKIQNVKTNIPHT